MGRTLAHHAEITRRIHNPAPKVMLPDTVRHHPCRKRMLRDRVSKFQPAAAVFEWQWIPIGLTQNRGEPSQHLFAQRVRIPAEVQLDVFGMSLILETHQVRILRRHGLGQRRHFGLHGDELAFLPGGQEAQQILALVFKKSIFLHIGLVILALHHVQPHVEVISVHNRLDHLLFVLEELELYQVTRKLHGSLVGVGFVVPHHFLVDSDHSLLFRDDLAHDIPEIRGKLKRLGVGAAALRHYRIPFLQIRMQLFGRRQVLEPALKGLRIELPGFSDFIQFRLGIAQNRFAHGHHVFGNLVGQGVRDADRGSARILLKRSFRRFHLLPLSLVSLHLILRCEAIFPKAGIGEHAA